MEQSAVSRIRKNITFCNIDFPRGPKKLALFANSPIPTATPHEIPTAAAYVSFCKDTSRIDLLAMVALDNWLLAFLFAWFIAED